jgi:hypothetical protein
VIGKKSFDKTFHHEGTKSTKKEKPTSVFIVILSFLLVLLRALRFFVVVKEFFAAYLALL